MRFERRRVQGYIDMGKVRVPPLPQYMVMTDRADGTLWLLSYNLTDLNPPADGFGRISITDVLPSTPDKLIFGPYEGPYVQEVTNEQGNPIIRLLIRDGHIGYEMPNFGPGVQSLDTARVLTRRGVANILREIVVPLAWRSAGDTLGWKVVDFP